MTYANRIRPLLATARIANVPSVISNVWAGIVIGTALQRWEHGSHSIWLDSILLALSGILLYVGGNFLNDWHDREWDAKNRPERALPTGLFTPFHYLVIAIILAIFGIILAGFVSWKCAIVASLIQIFIIIYTRWHKKAVWPVIPMGLCRALLPVMGFMGFSSMPLVLEKISPLSGSSIPSPTLMVSVHALALLIYIAGLSLGARYESSPRVPQLALLTSKVALLFSGLLAGSTWMILSMKAGLIALIPFAVWMLFCLTRFRRPIPVHVSALLAGIPLIDAIALLAYAQLSPAHSSPSALQPYITTCLVIPILTFAMGRMLQKLAPAT